MILWLGLILKNVSVQASHSPWICTDVPIERDEFGNALPASIGKASRMTSFMR